MKTDEYDRPSPGPWAWALSEPYFLQVFGSDKHAICEVYLDDAPVEDYNRRQRCNAQLLSAAPDLLEALLPFTEDGRDLTDLPCHSGICRMNECGRCSKVLRARLAVIRAGGPEERSDMPEPRVNFVCDICGRPAIEASTDIIRTSGPGDLVPTYEPKPNSKRIRCKAHKEPSKTFDKDGNLINEEEED
jgi:hypothetical protein